MVQAELLADVRNVIGESPVWRAETRTLFWVDAAQGEVYWRTDDGAVGTRSLAIPVTALIPRSDGGWVLVTKEGLHAASADFTTGSAIVDPAAGDPGVRLNDGVADRWGRVWTGSQSDAAPRDAVGRLYLVASSTDVTELDAGFAVANGIAMSPDGSRTYVSDMFHRRIRVYDVDPVSGDVRGALPPIETQAPGYPDGLAMDGEGLLWVAYWEGSRVDRLSPDGRVVKSVSVPAGHTTRACFGGADGRQLFVASANYALEPAVLTALPLSGAMFSAQVDASGLRPEETKL